MSLDDSQDDCYDLVSAKLALINHIILELPQQREPIAWISLFIVGYGIYEKTLRLFFFEDCENEVSPAVRFRQNTRNFSQGSSSILEHFDSQSTRVAPAKQRRQMFAHGDFCEEDLTEFSLDEIIDDLNHFREGILDAQTQIAEQS
ncbi:MAG: hypothetical protein KBF76_17485 [Verrucomicrobiales bacterium]|nr:hypothetical protein [Verrucomicrobiales bacterium]